MITRLFKPYSTIPHKMLSTLCFLMQATATEAQSSKEGDLINKQLSPTAMIGVSIGLVIAICCVCGLTIRRNNNQAIQNNNLEAANYRMMQNV